MAKQLQIRRGTTDEHGNFTGVQGELSVDTNKWTLSVHDGVTAGGHPLALEQKTPPALILTSSSGTIPYTDDPLTQKKVGWSENGAIKNDTKKVDMKSNEVLTIRVSYIDETLTELPTPTVDTEYGFANFNLGGFSHYSGELFLFNALTTNPGIYYLQPDGQFIVPTDETILNQSSLDVSLAPIDARFSLSSYTSSELYEYDQWSVSKWKKMTTVAAIIVAPFEQFNSANVLAGEAGQPYLRDETYSEHYLFVQGYEVGDGEYVLVGYRDQYVDDPNHIVAAEMYQYDQVSGTFTQIYTPFYEGFRVKGPNSVVTYKYNSTTGSYYWTFYPEVALPTILIKDSAVYKVRVDVEARTMYYEGQANPYSYSNIFPDGQYQFGTQIISSYDEVTSDSSARRVHFKKIESGTEFYNYEPTVISWTDEYVLDSLDTGYGYLPSELNPIELKVEPVLALKQAKDIVWKELPDGSKEIVRSKEVTFFSTTEDSLFGSFLVTPGQGGQSGQITLGGQNYYGNVIELGDTVLFTGLTDGNPDGIYQLDTVWNDVTSNYETQFVFVETVDVGCRVKILRGDYRDCEIQKTGANTYELVRIYVRSVVTEGLIPSMAASMGAVMVQGVKYYQGANLLLLSNDDPVHTPGLYRLKNLSGQLFGWEIFGSETTTDILPETLPAGMEIVVESGTEMVGETLIYDGSSWDNTASGNKIMFNVRVVVERLPLTPFGGGGYVPA